MICRELLGCDTRVVDDRNRRSQSPIAVRQLRGVIEWTYVFMIALILMHAAGAQTNLGRITGTVTDGTGAAIASAGVTVTNLSTTAIRNATTDVNGFYSVPALPVGDYSVAVSMAGFRSSKSTVDLTINGASANFTLVPGVVEQSVTVNAASGSVDLQTESHDLSQTVSPKQLINLPNSNGVSALSIAVLGPASQPGTDESESGDVGGFGQSTRAVNIAGLGLGRTQFLQDGVENINMLTQTANIVSTVEASSEVTTMINGAPSRFSEPAVVNVITKGGTNQFHGTAYDFFQNDAMNANNYFAVTKPPLRYNLFGGELGAPILRNRLFGYFDYSGLREHSSAVSRNRVPTSAELSGDFSNNNVSGTIYDPSTYSSATGTSSPFPSNLISPSRFDNFAKLWLANFPKANAALNSANVNYVANVMSPATSDQEVSRVDWNISDKNQAMGTYSHYVSHSGTDTIVPNLFGRYFNTSGTNIMLQNTYVFNPNIVNVAKAGYNMGNVVKTVQGAATTNFVQTYGLTNLNPQTQQWAPPSVTISAYTSYSAPFFPQSGMQNRFQYADEFDWKLNNHNISFGGQFVRIQFNGNWVVDNNGNYAFDGSSTSLYTNGKRSSTSKGNALADILLGYPVTAAGGVGISVGSFRESQVAAYLQDDWKVAHTFTVNLGLRYDLDVPPLDKNGKSAMYDLASNTASPGTWNTNYGDWGPRVGFAWNFTHSTVLRTGYGIYYSPILYNNLQFELLYSPNFAIQTKSFSIASPTLIEKEFGPSTTGTTAYSMQKRLKDQSSQEWNLNIEQSLGNDTLLTLGYVGNMSYHESARANINQPYALSSGNTSGIMDVKPQPLNGPVSAQLNIFNANYNALVASVQRRYANGLLFLASYTWSKAIDVVDGDNTTVQDQYNVNLQRSPATFDRTNNFLFSGVYDLPFGSGQRFAHNLGVAGNTLVGGWHLSFIQQIASGQPVAITANNQADTGGETVYALKTCNPTSGFTKTRFLDFNPVCYAQPAAGQYGNARNAVRIPGLNPTNLSLFKEFHLFEGQSVQFRVDAFSLLNHPMFGGPTTTVSSPALGQLTSEASGLRSLQVSLKYAF